MSDAKKAKARREPTSSRLLLALHERLVGYMARGGLIAFVDAPAPAPADPPAAPAPAPAAPAPAPTSAPAPADPPAATPAPAPAATPAPSPAPTPAPAPAAQVGAPEKYEAFTAPEGAQLDDATVAQFATMAREMGLPQEGAQKLVDMTLNAQIATTAAWTEAAKTDKEYGGDKFAENLAIAARARDQFGSPELKALLEKHAFGNHPEVIRFFYRAGLAISQDGFVPGRASGQPADARSLYSASNMNP
jgi:hypothetical protein